LNKKIIKRAKHGIPGLGSKVRGRLLGELLKTILYYFILNINMVLKLNPIKGGLSGPERAYMSTGGPR